MLENRQLHLVQVT